MASIPTHFVVGAALGQATGPESRRDWRFWAMALICSALPDIDVVGFGFGVRYGDLWGHRGMTHSVLFALAVGIAVGSWFGSSWTARIMQSVLFFFITISHGVFDAMTNGGLGIAFFSPFDQKRYFLPWRPILVSPIGVGFLSRRGVSVLQSEFIWVWPAAIVLGVGLYALRGSFEARAKE